MKAMHYYKNDFADPGTNDNSSDLTTNPFISNQIKSNLSPPVLAEGHLSPSPIPKFRKILLTISFVSTIVVLTVILLVLTIRILTIIEASAGDEKDIHTILSSLLNTFMNEYIPVFKNLVSIISLQIPQMLIDLKTSSTQMMQSLKTFPRDLETLSTVTQSVAVLLEKAKSTIPDINKFYKNVGKVTFNDPNIKVLTLEVPAWLPIVRQCLKQDFRQVISNSTGFALIGALPSQLFNEFEGYPSLAIVSEVYAITYLKGVMFENQENFLYQYFEIGTISPDGYNKPYFLRHTSVMLSTFKLSGKCTAAVDYRGGIFLCTPSPKIPKILQNPPDLPTLTVVSIPFDGRYTIRNISLMLTDEADIIYDLDTLQGRGVLQAMRFYALVRVISSSSPRHFPFCKNSWCPTADDKICDQSRRLGADGNYPVMYGLISIPAHSSYQGNVSLKLIDPKYYAYTRDASLFYNSMTDTYHYSFGTRGWVSRPIIGELLLGDDIVLTRYTVRSVSRATAGDCTTVSMCPQACSGGMNSIFYPLNFDKPQVTGVAIRQYERQQEGIIVVTMNDHYYYSVPIIKNGTLLISSVTDCFWLMGDLWCMSLMEKNNLPLGVRSLAHLTWNIHWSCS
ncbi:attachment glycoprotein [Salem virus]|uniref:Attachment glycoprotein n=1 Tax=Salem virus TaxID=120499 RepID=I6UKH4_9MONO|nr:attachment glycoprotein [Salem virus]AFM97197.1 attachment glycoprotein [Salem virus]